MKMKSSALTDQIDAQIGEWFSCCDTKEDARLVAHAIQVQADCAYSGLHGDFGQRPAVFSIHEDGSWHPVATFYDMACAREYMQYLRERYGKENIRIDIHR